MPDHEMPWDVLLFTVGEAVVLHPLTEGGLMALRTLDPTREGTGTALTIPLAEVPDLDGLQARTLTLG